MNTPVFPIYERDGRAFIDTVRSCSTSDARADSYHHSRNTISETTLILLLGEVSDPHHTVDYYLAYSNWVITVLRERAEYADCRRCVERDGRAYRTVPELLLPGEVPTVVMDLSHLVRACVRRCAFDCPYTAYRVNVILIKIPFGFLRLLGPQLWRDVSRYEGIVASGISPREEVS